MILLSLIPKFRCVGAVIPILRFVFGLCDIAGVTLFISLPLFAVMAGIAGAGSLGWSSSAFIISAFWSGGVTLVKVVEVVCVSIWFGTAEDLLIVFPP